MAKRLGIWVYGLWLRVKGLRYMVQGSGFRVYGLWFRVQGLGLPVDRHLPPLDTTPPRRNASCERVEGCKV